MIPWNSLTSTDKNMIVVAWAVQNPMGRLAGCRLGDEVQFKSKGSLLAEFLPA